MKRDQSMEIACEVVDMTPPPADFALSNGNKIREEKKGGGKGWIVVFVV